MRARFYEKRLRTLRTCEMCCDGLFCDVACCAIRIMMIKMMRMMVVVIVLQCLVYDRVDEEFSSPP